MKSNPPSRVLARIALCLLMSLAGMLATGCGRGGQPPPLSSQDQSVLDTYEQIRLALANDDFPTAKKRAIDLIDLVKSSDSTARPSAIQADAQIIVDASALDRQRQGFRALSAQLTPLVKGRPGYYLFSAPIEPQAVWIQRGDSADNPYLGKVMHDAGAPTS